MNNIVKPESGVTILFNIVNSQEQCGQQNIVQYGFHQLGTSCSFFAVYTRKNYELLKTGLNNVVLPILLIVVNNIEQVVEPESSLQSGVTMLNNIVDNIEQCGQHNIVQSCFQQPVATHNFWPCNTRQKIMSLQFNRIEQCCAAHIVYSCQQH